MIKQLYFSLFLLFAFACGNGDVDPANGSRNNNPSNPRDGSQNGNQSGSKPEKLADVVDDPELVDFLSGRWGFYSKGEGNRYDTHRFDFANRSIQFEYTWTYNNYVTLYDIQIVKNKYFLKIEKNILFKSTNGSVFEKFGRIEKISSDQMKLYPITETGTSYKEFLPYQLTKINSTEVPAADVIADKKMISTLTGKWVAGTATVFDFSDGKNYYQLTTTFQGAKTIEKIEFKVTADGLLHYRKWENDFDPSWKLYKVSMKGDRLIISSDTGRELYSLIKEP